METSKPMKKEQAISFLFCLVFFSIIQLSCNNNYTKPVLADTDERIKGLGAEVTQPIVLGIPAPNSIAVSAVRFIDGNYGNQIAEYAISRERDALPGSLVWQTSTIFARLTPAMTYFVFARSAENADHQAGQYRVSNPIRVYNVSFYGNGATGGTLPGIRTAFRNDIIILPERGNLVRANFAFGCWNTQIDGNGVNLIPGQQYQVTGNQILYAKWLPEQIHIFPFVPPENNAPIVSGITISQTGTGNYPTTGILQISNPDDYSLIEWFYGSIRLGEGPILELDAADIRYNLAGTHNITVVVWQDDMPYSLRISFFVVG